MAKPAHGPRSEHKAESREVYAMKRGRPKRGERRRSVALVTRLRSTTE